MPRVQMTENYTCAERTFVRGRDYDVTDARARMLTGRGSARLVKAAREPVRETAEAPAPEETGADGTADPAAPAEQKPTGRKPKPAPKPKK